jgi:hypothetical protein
MLPVPSPRSRASKSHLTLRRNLTHDIRPKINGRIGEAVVATRKPVAVFFAGAAG